MSVTQERIQIREDLLNGKVPRRVPVYVTFTLEAACGFAGVDLMRAHFDPEVKHKAYAAVCKHFYSDAFPLSNFHYPPARQILGSLNWVLSSSGAIQHPEIEPLQFEEYDDLIADPYACVVDKIMPRVCANLDTDSTSKALVLAKAYSSFKKCRAEEGAVIGELVQKHAYSPGLITGSVAVVPFDCIADNFRGFKTILTDIRRAPEKVKQACDALLPVMTKLSEVPSGKKGLVNFIPLHLGPYINKKQFDELYWPTMEKLVNAMRDMGLKVMMFAEQDWTRWGEYLAALPDTALYLFENGDYAHLKATAGKNHIIGGFFDPTITLTRSTEYCIDEVKRIVDTCAPGGRFYFNFNKSIMDIKSIDVKKVQAILEWVHTHTDY